MESGILGELGNVWKRSVVNEECRDGKQQEHNSKKGEALKQQSV